MKKDQFQKSHATVPLTAWKLIVVKYVPYNKKITEFRRNMLCNIIIGKIS